LLPISCAPSLVKTCAFSNSASLLTKAHMIESFMAGAILFILPSIWLWLNQKNPSQIKKITLLFVNLQIILGGLVVAEKLIGGHSFGIIHRFYLLGIGIWLAAILFIAIEYKITTQKDTTTNNL